MKFLYYDKEVYLTGRWAIEPWYQYYILKVEVCEKLPLPFLVRKFWANSDYLYEVNECTTNG